MMGDLNRMSEPATGRLYDLWSRFYDATFGALVHSRHLRAMDELRLSPGDRVLDLGVGTGMTLPRYPHDVRVVGMDLSAGMLNKARHKCAQDGLEHVQLIQGDAMHPPFADGSFDHVLIAHTVSVVSEPNRLMQWARRLVKPGGSIILLNHFRSTHRAMAWLETIFNPLFVKIGWRSDLSLEECLEGVDLHVRYRFKSSAIDLWQIVVLGTDPPRPGPRTADAQPPTAAAPHPLAAG